MRTSAKLPPVHREPPSKRSKASPVGRRQFLVQLAGAAIGAGLYPTQHVSASSTTLEDVRSKYNHIRIVQRGSTRTMYFVDDQDGTQYIESRIDADYPQSLDLDYTRTMMAGFLLQPQPTRLLMLGIGGGQMSNYLYRRVPGFEIDAVDIDPDVLRLAQKYFHVPTTDPRYRCHVNDARLFVESAPAGTTWDMIMLDCFRGVFVPYHLKTVEFYQAILARLSPQGVVVANLHNKSQMYSHDRETLAEVFPNRYSFVSESGNQTTLVASADPRRISVFQMRERARTAQPCFDIDLLGLAARYYMRCDWEPGALILRDDFKPDELELAAQRHNKTCIRNCKYAH